MVVIIVLCWLCIYPTHRKILTGTQRKYLPGIQGSRWGSWGDFGTVRPVVELIRPLSGYKDVGGSIPTLASLFSSRQLSVLLSVNQYFLSTRYSSWTWKKTVTSDESNCNQKIIWLKMENEAEKRLWKVMRKDYENWWENIMRTDEKRLWELMRKYNENWWEKIMRKYSKKWWWENIDKMMRSGDDKHYEKK
jgi:hypothetical protein